MTCFMPPIRLRSVTGFNGRINDIVFCPPAIKTDENSTVVYFGGDVQDYAEAMEVLRDNKNYVKWHLENMAAILHVNFPRSSIVVVRPSRMEFKTFSCYNNFVPGNNVGAPDHTPTHHALQHLEKLLQNITSVVKSLSLSKYKDLYSSSFVDLDILQPKSENFKSDLDSSDPVSLLQRMHNSKTITVTASSNNDAPSPPEPESHVTITQSTKQEIEDRLSQSSVIQPTDNSSVLVTPHCQSDNPDQKKEETDPLWWQDKICLDRGELKLIGFSKGCVVLNQFIYEFHYLKTLTPDDMAMSRFVSRISEMYWLDGGHSGGKNTWITSRSLLETLIRLDIRIFVHVTPYQVQDDRRSWIRCEEKTFTELLQKLNARISRTLHFEGDVPNLHMHFKVLNVFMNQNQKDQPAAPNLEK